MEHPFVPLEVDFKELAESATHQHTELGILFCGPATGEKFTMRKCIIDHRTGLLNNGYRGQFEGGCRKLEPKKEVYRGSKYQRRKEEKGN